MTTFADRVEAQIRVPAGVAVAATNSGGGPTAVPLVAGVYYPAALVAHLVSQLNATRTPATWTGSLSLATGQVTLSWSGTGTYSLAWTSSALRDVLGFAADLVGVTQSVASVGTKQMRGLWFPDCPLNLDLDTARAPLVTDARAAVGPRGAAVVLVSNASYRHKNLKWTHVAKARVWEAAAALTNASWETFWTDAHLGLGPTGFFTPGSALMVYDSNGVALGADKSIAGWVASNGPTSTEPRKVDTAWTGLWEIAIPELVSSG